MQNVSVHDKLFNMLAGQLHEMYEVHARVCILALSLAKDHVRKHFYLVDTECMYQTELHIKGTSAALVFIHRQKSC